MPTHRLPMPDDCRIQLLNWSDARPLARAVREEVFIREQGVPRELEWDQWDEPSDHALAFDAGSNAVGTARLLPDGHIGRMAVLRAWRGRGVGAALLGALIERARMKRMDVVKLNAQTHAAGFYRRFGFVAQGAEFIEAGIPHVAMSLRIGRAAESGS